jgi:phospholipid-binding lipoprotein MlaA
MVNQHPPLLVTIPPMKKPFSLFAAIILLASLSACATAPTDPAERAEFEAANDPLEPTNRVIFEFNQIVDKVLLRPLAYAYREVVPDFAQDVVHNVLQNAGEPIVFMNALLQGRTEDAGKTFNRFLVNTTVGLGGVADIAGDGGLKKVDADFGQTLHVWGMPEGPYLVLPILGPSNPRDAVGFGVDTVASPWSYLAAEGGSATRNRYIIADLGATMLDRRSKSIDALDALEKGSVDFYAQLRSVSRQYRSKQLGIARAESATSIRDFEDDGVPVRKKTSKRKPAAKPAAAPAPAQQESAPLSPL